MMNLKNQRRNWNAKVDLLLHSWNRSETKNILQGTEAMLHRRGSIIFHSSGREVSINNQINEWCGLKHVKMKQFMEVIGDLSRPVIVHHLWCG